MNFVYHLIVLIAANLLLVLGYNMVFGKGKILHFGHQGQALIAAYAMWVSYMQFQLPFVISLLVAISLATGVSLIFAWLSLKLEPDGYGVMSIAVHLFALAVVLNWNSVTRGALGIPRIPRLFLPDTLPLFALMCLVVALVYLWFIRQLDKGPFGRQVAALSEHEWHAQGLGVSRRAVHIKLFLIAAVGPIISGLIFSPYLHLLTPQDYNFPAMIFYVMIVVAGNPGSLWGSTLATALLILLKEGLRFTPIVPAVRGPLLLIMFGVILFAAVWWRRDTLFPHQRKV